MSDRTPPQQPEGPHAAHEETAPERDAAPRAGAPGAPEPQPALAPAHGDAAAERVASVGPSPEHPAALEELDPVAMRRWAFRARAALARHRGGIDALNVFPVPDGDTGTNMLATLTGALRAGERHDDSDGSADSKGSDTSGAASDSGQEPDGESSRLEVVARTSVTAARGNSGAILGELLRGLSQVAGAGRARIDGPTLAAALRTASERAWLAVGRPVEGTMLSVARAAAAAADQAARGGGQLVDVTAAAVEAARAALASTPEQLPTLKHAGVVDAGGAGLLVVLTALHDVVTGGRSREKPTEGSGEGSAPQEALDSVPSASGPHGPATREGHRGGPGEEISEVMYVVTGADPAARTLLREELDALGDSVIVAGDSHGATVHVHTSEVESVIAHGRAAGTVTDLRIEPLLPAGSETSTRAASRVPVRRSVLCHRLSMDLGDVLPGVPFERHGKGAGEDRAPEAGLAVILVTDLPEDSAPASHAQPGGPEATEEQPPRHVVSCESVPAALAALAVYDGADDAVEPTVDAMRAAALAVTAIALPRRPSRDGDAAGSEPGRAFVEFTRRVEAALEAGGELVTIVAGPDGAATADALAQELQDRDVEVARFEAAEPLTDHLVVVGVE